MFEINLVGKKLGKSWDYRVTNLENFIETLPAVDSFVPGQHHLLLTLIIVVQQHRVILPKA